MTARQALALKDTRHFAETMSALLEREGLTPQTFLERNQNEGVPIEAYRSNRQLAGLIVPRRQTLDVWAAVLNEPIEKLVELVRTMPSPDRSRKYHKKNGRPHKAQSAPPAPARMAKQEAEFPMQAPVARGTLEPAQFSFVVSKEGTVRVTLDMSNLPLEVAVRVMGALTSAGVLASANPEAGKH